MHLSRFCGLAVLVLAGSVEAQERPAPDPCAGLAEDSFEAAVLGCDPAAGSVDHRQPPAVEEVLGPISLNQPVRLSEGLGEGGTDAWMTGPDPEGSHATVRVSRGLSGVENLSGAFITATSGDEGWAVPQVPDGQRPPPGTCRVWFPDRHPGLQRPPTSCDVEVPEGAVLIRG